MPQMRVLVAAVLLVSADASQCPDAPSSLGMHDLVDYVSAHAQLQKYVSLVVEQELDGQVLMMSDQSELIQLGFTFGAAKRLKKCFSDTPASARATEDGENGSRAAVGGSVQPIDAAGSIDSIYNSLQERILAMEEIGLGSPSLPPPPPALPPQQQQQQPPQQQHGRQDQQQNPEMNIAELQMHVDAIGDLTAALEPRQPAAEKKARLRAQKTREVAHTHEEKETCVPPISGLKVDMALQGRQTHGAGTSASSGMHPSCPAAEHNSCCGCFSDEVTWDDQAGNWAGEWDNGLCCGHCAWLCDTPPTSSETELTTITTTSEDKKFISAPPQSPRGVMVCFDDERGCVSESAMDTATADGAGLLNLNTVPTGKRKARLDSVEATIREQDIRTTPGLKHVLQQMKLFRKNATVQLAGCDKIAELGSPDVVVKRGVAQEGGIEHAFDAMYFHLNSTGVQDRCAIAVAHLANVGSGHQADMEFERRVMEKRGLTLLINGSRAHSPPLARPATTRAGRLARRLALRVQHSMLEASRTLLLYSRKLGREYVALGGVPITVTLMRNHVGHADIQHCGAAVLAELFIAHLGREEALDVGAFAVILDGMKAHSSTEAVQQWGVSALWAMVTTWHRTPEKDPKSPLGPGEDTSVTGKAAVMWEKLEQLEAIAHIEYARRRFGLNKEVNHYGQDLETGYNNYRAAKKGATMDR